MSKRNIELAAEAGAHWEHGDWNLASSVHFSEEDLQTFAELIRADERDRATRENAYVLAEREACAKLLEDASKTGKIISCMSAAAAIRARGNK